MKKCFKCGIEKELSEFYVHKRMADGHLNKCIECTKNDVSMHREENIEKIKEYDRIRGRSPKRLKMNRERSRNAAPEQKKKISESKKRWREANKEKRAAQVILGNAIRSGRVKKPEYCSECGSDGRINGHHDDYCFPLTVKWLCCKCHGKTHRRF